MKKILTFSIIRVTYSYESEDEKAKHFLIMHGLGYTIHERASNVDHLTITYERINAIAEG
jgi:hypothetical protein